jgi:formyl-CoA transferase
VRHHPGALDGLRVLDLSRVLAGPYCTMTLGNLGADVVKVERPGSGDDTRQWGPPFVGGEAAYYLSCNSSKRSLTVDLSQPAGRDLVRRLAAHADVLIENFKAGAMEGWGLGYEHLAVENPGLVYCAILGYDRAGPYRDRPGYDFIAQAMGGIMSVTGVPEGEPMKVGVAIVDVTAGLYATVGILAALQARAHSGRGQRVDVNLLDAAAGWLVNVAANYLATGRPPGRYGNAHPNIVPYQVFQASDGYVAVGIGNDAQWRRLCAALGRPEMAADERYASNALRQEHREPLVAAFAETFATGTVDEWVRAIEAAGVPVGPINTVDKVFETPGLLSPAMLATLPHPTVGSVRVVGTPIGLSETPAAPRSAPPTLGQHTREVLRDWLGLDDGEIDALRESGVV